MSNRVIRYIDAAAVAQAMTDKHQRRRRMIQWSVVLNWIVLLSMVVAFWWWALFC